MASVGSRLIRMGPPPPDIMTGGCSLGFGMPPPKIGLAEWSKWIRENASTAAHFVLNGGRSTPAGGHHRVPQTISHLDDVICLHIVFSLPLLARPLVGGRHCLGRSDLPSVADSPLCIVPPADAVTVVQMIHPFIAHFR